MRNRIAAGNWKMNLTVKEGLQLATEIKNNSGKNNNAKIILCPPFLHLMPLKEHLGASNLSLGAQNCCDRINGAFTGEVSVKMLADVGIEYVIIGHSERRIYYHESNEVLKTKIDVALEFSLKPIFCCGEPLEIRIDNKQENYVLRQLEDSLFHLSSEQIKNTIIAYEPIWAIGTGKNASAQEAQDMHAFIRSKIEFQYDKETAESISILYGGSVKADNAASIFSMPDVDGGLVGGASLNASEFVSIIAAL